MMGEWAGMGGAVVSVAPEVFDSSIQQQRGLIWIVASEQLSAIELLGKASISLSELYSHETCQWEEVSLRNGPSGVVYMIVAQ
jgi:hypothetical protein